MLVFTSCVANYLPKARVLAKSLKRFHPEWTFVLLLAEMDTSGLDGAQEPFDQILTIGDLGIPSWQSWMFQYSLVELCTALKGAALEYLLKTRKPDKILYLDPDIWVLNSLATLENALDEHDILLTPHQLTPQAKAADIIANELTSLQHGVFNLGFLGLANRPEGRRFASFWWDRLKTFCRDDKSLGLFTDQKWCDLAPAYFPSLGVIRDPGCNAATWNMSERRIWRDDKGVFYANDSPLKFYHFTGHDSGAGHANALAYKGEMPALAELWELYERQLRENGQGEWGNHAWSGAAYQNGAMISAQARACYRDNPKVRALYPDPYASDAAGTSGFVAHFHKKCSARGRVPVFNLIKMAELARLGARYLNKHGGFRALPRLMRKVVNAVRNGGLGGLRAQIAHFSANTALQANRPQLEDLLKGVQGASIARAFKETGAILLLDHQYGGGANAYRDKRIQGYVENGKACLLLTWDFFGDHLNCRIYLPDGAILEAWADDLLGVLQTRQLHFERIIVNELVLWSLKEQRGRNHYHALPALIEGILALKKLYQAFLEIPVHDFYCICPSYTLLEKGRVFCGVSQDMPRCHSCLAEAVKEIPADFDLAAWQAVWSRLLCAADEIRFFSRSSRDLVCKKYDLDQAKVAIVPHEPLARLAPLPAKAAGEPLSIGVIGEIVQHKGAEIVREIGRELARDEKLTVIGELEGKHPANIEVTGRYDRADLPELCARHKVNCLLVPSIWPETFCYTAQESIQLNLPLVVFPLGAQAEWVGQYRQGKIAREVSAKAALAAMRELRQECGQA